MKKLNQIGIAHTGIVLVVVLIGLVGFTGWKVYDSSKKSKESLDNANKSDSAIVEKKATGSSSSNAKEQKTADPTSDWSSYSNKTGKFSLKYPKSWVRPESEELCSPELLLLGQSKASVGKCGSESAGEVSISSSLGDIRKDSSLDSKYYSDYKVEAVTINGIAGEKQTAVVKGDEEMWLGPVVGTKVTKYIFYTGGRTYVANYDQLPSATSILDDFNLLVTKTLKFE